MCDLCFAFIDDRPTRQELEAEAAYDKWAATLCDDCGEYAPNCMCPPECACDLRNEEEDG